jgi:hypothetical protein
MHVKKLCELVKTGLLTNFIYASILSMYCDVWRDYAKQIYATAA